MTQPYFIYPMLRQLESTSDRAERARLRQRIAANVGSPEALRDLFGLDTESLAGFYSDMSAPHLTTDDTIDTFLEQFGSRKALLPDDALFPGEGIPGRDPLLGGVDIPSDYMAALEAGEIPQQEDPAPEAEASDNTSLSEGFARILIKNGNYSKALEIINELYLKNPEKSIYFADQIRFIKKLIFNQSRAGK